MAECAVCTEGCTVDFQQQPALRIVCSINVENGRGVHMCIHPWNCRSDTALWVPEYRWWTQKESLLWLSEGHNRTGLLIPIQRVRCMHLLLAQQSLNFPGGFRRFYISLTMLGEKSLVQASILLSGWLRSCCPHICLPLCYPSWLALTWGTTQCNGTMLSNGDS